MAKEANEIDSLKQTVLREHLAKLSKITPPEQSSGAFTLDRGYLNENEEATPLGEQYLVLRDNGLMDDNGELTPDGRVYAMSQRESVSGSFDDYEKRENLGLNDFDKTSGDMPTVFESIGMQIKDVITKGIPNAISATAPLRDITYFPKIMVKKAITGKSVKELIDPAQKLNDILSLARGSLLAFEPLGTGTYYALGKASLPLISDNDTEKDRAALMLKKEYEKKRYEYNDITGSDVLTALMAGSTLPGQIRDTLIKEDGEEEVIKREKALEITGSFIDPTLAASFGTTALMKGAAATVTRSIVNAEKLALRSTVFATRQAGVRAEIATLESALSKAENVGSRVAERASALDSIGNTASASRYKATANKIGESMEEIKGQIDELVAVDSKITTDLVGLSQKAGVGDALLKINNKVQQFNNLPAQVVGDAFEGVGSGLIKADAWLDDIATRTGLGGAYDALKSIPGISAGLVLGPFAAIPAVGARVLASGPLIESVGRYTKVLGKELMQARGSVSYWRRVANNPKISPVQKFLSHRMDELTLGGRVPELAKNVAAGTAVSFPMNLSIEYLQDPYGESKDILGRAAAASFVFGGGSAGAGQIFKGSTAALKSTRLNDEFNFTRNLLESQKAGYNSLPKGARRSISTYAAAFPNLNFDFVDGTPSRYDPVTNTVEINTKSNNPLRPLIAHEVGHYLSIRNGVNPLVHSMLLGDPETPGILRKTNGELDPQFQKFKDEYDKRTDAANIDRRSLELVAEEYFIENTVDHMVEMVESGEISKMAGRTQVGRQVRKLIEATMPRVPILKDFFFRSGGVMQAGGRFVKGNGLLAEGLKEIPEARAMMRNLIRDTAGEASSTPRGKGDKGDAGNRLPVQKGDPILESFHSIFESDQNGKTLLDKDGDPIALSRATDEARSAAGLVITEEQTRRVRDGYMPEDGEIRLDPNTGWFGRFIATPVINALAAKGILNSKQIATLRNINTGTKLGNGTRYMVINHPATIKGRGGKVRYASIEATLRETVPVGFSITKTGNIMVHLMSVDQLHKNITSRAASKSGQSLYQGNTEAIKIDVSAMMDLHANKTKTDAYYQEKYGARWEEYQMFVNTIFGQMTKEQKSINPMFDADKISGNGVYRTYRLDRISKATKMDGLELPFGYDYVKVNYFPDGVVDKSGQAPEQSRQMPEALDISPEDVNPVANRQEAVGLFADGKRMFAFDEMDGTPTEITSLEMLNSYTPDTIGWIEPEADSGARYMPEPLNPKTYENQKGYDTAEILKSKLDDDGKIILTKPTAPNGALTLLSDRRKVTKEIPIETRDQFLYDELAKVVLYKNEGKDVSFNYDPNTQVKPVIKDAAVELSGKKVQIAMADRAMAALGDLGGILFPNLRVNQITFTGPDGIKYRPVWANMGWKPVLAMKVKAIQQGSVNLLTYIMGKDAHASNLRSVRTVSNEIANAGLQKHHEDLFITLANYGKMLENNATQVKTIQKHSNLIAKLNEEITPENKVKTKKEILKKKDLIKKAKEKITKIPKEFESLSSVIKAYRSASTGFENETRSLANKNLRLADLEAYLKTPKFNKLASEYSGKQLIDVSNSFKGRKAALNATTGFEIEGFSVNKVIDAIGEFKGATNNQVLGAVELSSNPDLFAIYLGDNPKQIKFMSETEKAAAKYFKEHPDFVRHEAYDWVQLGPVNGNNFLNSNPKKLVDYFKDFGDKYKKATGKLPKTENAKVGAMRDGMSVVLEMPKIKKK